MRSAGHHLPCVKHAGHIFAWLRGAIHYRWPSTIAPAWRSALRPESPQQLHTSGPEARLGWRRCAPRFAEKTAHRATSWYRRCAPDRPTAAAVSAARNAAPTECTATPPSALPPASPCWLPATAFRRAVAAGRRAKCRPSTPDARSAAAESQAAWSNCRRQPAACMLRI